MNVRRWTAVAVGLAITGGGIVAGQNSASATVNSDVCAAQYVCVYIDANWSNMLAKWNGNTTTSRSNFAKDMVSSWQNHSGRKWCTRDDRNLASDVATFVMLPGQSQSIVAPAFNDKADYAIRC